MSLQAPKPIFSAADKRLLALMAKLLTENNTEKSERSNLPLDEISLTDREADELANSLDQVVNSKKFVQAAYFSEAVTDANQQQTAREIYLSERQRNGRSRALATNMWADFQTRLGIHIPPIHLRAATPMSYSYFEKMERRLLNAAGLSPRVVDLVMQTVSQQQDAVEAIRAGKRRLSHGIIKQAAIDPLMKWFNSARHLPDRTIPKERIVGATIVLADITVMFTTRDWGVTGTLSTFAGGAASMLDG